MSNQVHTQNDSELPHTDDSAEKDPSAGISSKTTADMLESPDDLVVEETAVSDLLATAEQFNAVFNTALYELESSRKLIRERAARIDELNESIKTIGHSLDEERSKNRGKDEEHTRKVEELERKIHEIEAERDRLHQQASEQEAALNADAEESGKLSQRVDELSRSLEQHKAEALHAREELIRERDALTSKLEELQKEYEVIREQLDTLQKEREEVSRHHENELDSQQAANNKLAAHVEKLQTLNRALHESILSEGDMHNKTLEQKDGEIEALRTSTGDGNDMPDGALPDSGETEKLQTALHELESRLAETEAQRQVLGERVKLVDELESEVSRLGAALQAAENTEQPEDAHAEHLEALNMQVVDLESALATARAEHEVLTVKLNSHETLEQEVVILRETVQQANGKLHEQEETCSSVDALKKEVESLKSALADTDEKYVRLQTTQQETTVSGDTVVGDTPAPAQDPVAVAPTKDRDQFITLFNNLLAEPPGARKNRAVMYVLMDNFIRIRDEIGIMNSEHVISEVSGIIDKYCDEGDIVTRISDCAFAILTDASDIEVAREKAESIRSTIEDHIFEVAGHSLITSTSIGVCSTRDSDDNAEKVVARADMACESARTSGGNQVLVSSVVTDEVDVHGKSDSHAEIVSKVLNDNRIKIYYQPISSLKDVKSHCYEVLTRVIDEDGNIILPGEFFSMAINSGKAMDVDLYVIENIMSMIAVNPDQVMLLFVKLTRQSVASQDFAIWVMEKLKEYKVDPKQLVFEVAESLLQNELKNLSMLTKALQTMGCKVAVEHYRMSSQPQNLQHIHADYLKLDSGLVQNIGSKGKCIEKVTEIMEVARRNNYTVIAEGVESPACLAILWELGVSLAQGYFIQAPAGNMGLNEGDIDVDINEEESN